MLLKEMGPSPPTRGNLQRSFADHCFFGTIPAYAGEPSVVSVSSPMTRDHPRLRGGTNGKTLDGGYATGPSPPTRGNQCYDRARRVIVGTIPAYAGEPYRRAACAVLAEDHPRLRGGTPASPSAVIRIRGPSPPTRGNQGFGLCDAVPAGTIPACAGEPPI